MFLVLASIPYSLGVSQASLWILRVAVGIVSNVDLPLNDVLGAAVKATGAALVDGIGTEVPSTINTDRVSVFAEGETAAKTQQCKNLQGAAYDSLCKFMREVEASPPRGWFGCPRCHRQSTPPAVNWKTSMVQERNRNGGWAWVLKENLIFFQNREAYVRENRKAASAGSV